MLLAESCLWETEIWVHVVLFVGGLRRYYNPPWFTDIIPSEPYDPLTLRHAFEKVYCLSPSIVRCWMASESSNVITEREEQSDFMWV
jgi:hypothetical protein